MHLEVDDGFKALSAYCEGIAGFFRRRAELEAQHLAELEKLLNKQEDSDRRLEPLFANSSISAAWNQIKLTVHTELVERRQCVYKSQHGVIEPLVAFKDQKERQRKRIKEETSNTASEHSDYKAHTLRLKRLYNRKSEEVRSLTQSNELSPTSSNGSGHLSPPASGGLSTFPSTSSGDSVPLANEPAATHNGGSWENSKLLISGATSTSLRDAQSPPPRDSAALFAIKSSRHQLNSLIQKLSSSTAAANARLSSATSSSSTAPSSTTYENNLKPSNVRYRLSKAKREAEQSDANYRSALHHLETLRLQRERVGKASSGSLEEFVLEFSSICKSIFSQYCESWATQAQQTSQLCEVAKSATFAIVPTADVVAFNNAANIPTFYEQPLPYENYHVGVSYSLIFGVSLNEYSVANDGVLVPLTVQRAILEIDSRGLDVEGIYRVPGKLGLIQQIVQEVEQDEITFEFLPEKHDVHTVAGVLKLYLRQLPEALFPIDSKDRDHISSLSPAPTEVDDPTTTEAYRFISKKLRKMSPSHQATAKMLVAHFARVLGRTERNKMSVQALTLCLNPVLFPEELDLGAFSQGHKDRSLEYLITYRQELFAGLSVLEEARNPYRNPRLSGSAPDLDDEDPPYRRSQESLKRSIPRPPSRQMSPPPARKSFEMAATSRKSSDSERHARHHQQHITHTNLMPKHPASAPMSVSTSQDTAVSPGKDNGSHEAVVSPDMTGGAGYASAFDAPQRTLSQRAKSGSQSLANAMKSLRRPRTSSIGQSGMMSPPLPSAYQPASPPPMPGMLPPPAPLPSFSAHELPAGAAPLLGRPPSFTDTIPTSSSPTAGHTAGYTASGAASTGLSMKDPATLGRLRQSPSIDPDSIYETYHQAAQNQ